MSNPFLGKDIGLVLLGTVICSVQLEQSAFIWTEDKVEAEGEDAGSDMCSPLAGFCDYRNERGNKTWNSFFKKNKTFIFHNYKSNTYSGQRKAQ